MSNLDNLIILKRDNQKSKFNGEKIAVAIKKGFDSLELKKYDGTDVNNVYNAVLATLEESAKLDQFVSIEHIQDLIERELLRQNDAMNLVRSLSLSNISS